MDERHRQGIDAGTNPTIVKANFAGVRRVDTGEDFDQRRLAGAVLAEQRVDFAAPDVEIDAVERQRSGESLGEARHFEKPAGRRGVLDEQFGLGHPRRASPVGGAPGAASMPKWPAGARANRPMAQTMARRPRFPNSVSYNRCRG